MMKFLRNNFAYIVLALVAIVLIFVTISLQVAILSTQPVRTEQGAQAVFSRLRQQLATWISPATDTPTGAGQPAVTAVVLPTRVLLAPTDTPMGPTNTPMVIVLQPTPLPLTLTATPTPSNPVATATANFVLTFQARTSNVATRIALPTATGGTTTAPLPPVAAAAPTPLLPLITSPLPTPTPAVAVDFRLGYVDRNSGCAAVTALMQLVMEREFDLQIATVAFPGTDSLFEKLAAKTAAEHIDLSFCYTDPVDRPYLQKYFGFIIFIGSGYRQVADQKFIIMSNAAVKSPIERGNPCLYRFFTNLNLNDFDFNSEDVATWYAHNVDTIASWVRCE
ncbi:MAG: hypothetical protein R3E79_12170 [Caldilineaceae bacterium]